MKKAAVTLFVLGAISIFIFFCWMFFAFIYFFQEPREYESMGFLLELSRYQMFWIILGSLTIYTLSLYGLSKAGNRVNNPKYLINALQLRGWKIIFAVLATLPLLVIKLVRVIWQSRPLKNTRSFSKEVMESFS
jgi:hypothetical protein